MSTKEKRNHPQVFMKLGGNRLEVSPDLGICLGVFRVRRRQTRVRRFMAAEAKVVVKKETSMALVETCGTESKGQELRPLQPQKAEKCMKP